MLNYIAAYPNSYEKDFNEQILLSTQDNSIVDFIITEMKEIEAVGNITIENVEVVYDLDEVDINNHTVNINFKKKDMDSIEIPKYKYIADGRYGEVIFTIRVETNLNSKTIEKRILFPIEMDGYYYNNGKKMRSIWQLTDAGCYSQRGKITLKSRMPVIIYQNKKRYIDDVLGNTHVTTGYSYALNGKSRRPGAAPGGRKPRAKFINPLMIYAAKMGLSNTIDFFGMKDIIEPINEFSETDHELYYIFQINNIFIRVEKSMFDKYDLVKSFMCMLYNLKVYKDFPVTFDNMDDNIYWTCRIGMIGATRNKNMLSFLEKGNTNILMIERLLNKVTQDTLRLPEQYKHNIYYLIYWLITNFDDLRKYSNTDMKSKRIRKNEYIVNSSLGKKLSDNVIKLIERKGRSKMNTMATLLELFNFGSDIIVAGMRNLNDLIKTDDITNDMTMIQDISYSSKGPNSIGSGNSKMIADKYRFLDPSMIGVVDLNVSSNSDIGMTGSFTPFVELYDNYFFDSEPQTCENRYLFDKALVEVEGRKLQVDTSSFQKYLNSLNDMERFNELLQHEPILIVEKERAMPISAKQ